jgi:hypothetical protein
MCTISIYGNTNNTKRVIVCFDVGGRIYKIRHTIVDTFPESMLSRVASELWNTTMIESLVMDSSLSSTAAKRNDGKCKKNSTSTQLEPI